MKQRKRVLMDEVYIKYVALYGQTVLGSCPTRKKHLEQMLKDLIEEAAEMDLEPEPASLWWTSTYASENKEDIILGTSKGSYKLPF